MKSLAILLGLSFCLGVNAQFTITSFSPKVITFDSTLAGVNNGTFTGQGFYGESIHENPGMLSSGAWATIGWSDGGVSFGDTQFAGTDFGRGSATSAVSTPGIYGFQGANWGNSSMLGIKPGRTLVGEGDEAYFEDDFNPGHFQLKIVNNTGVTINTLNVSYEVWARNSGDRSTSFNFSHGQNALAGVAMQNPEASLDYSTLATADALAPSSVNRNIVLSDLNLVHGGTYYFRWTSLTLGTGSFDEIGLDNISITAVPEPHEYALGSGLLLAGFAGLRRWQNKNRRVTVGV